MLLDPPKKLCIPYIIDILKKYTDENTTLTQKEILDLLKSEFSFEIDRKTLSRNLRDAKIYDERINNTICKRNGEILTEFTDGEGTIYTNYYYQHMFEKSELNALIYNVAFSKHIKSNYKKEIIEKLESLRPVSLKHNNMKYYVDETNRYSDEFSDLFLYLDDIDNAINASRIVEFNYASYNESMNLQVSEELFQVFPLGVAEHDNDFYLIGLECGVKSQSPEELVEYIKTLIDNVERKARWLDSFRIDRMRNLCIKEEDFLSSSDQKISKQMSIKSIYSDCDNILEYVRKNSTLSSGRIIKAKFKMVNGKNSISDVIDFFGKENIRMTVENIEGSFNYNFTVNTNDRSMMEFAKKYINEVEIISPNYLRDEMKDMLKAAYERMGG